MSCLQCMYEAQWCTPARHLTSPFPRFPGCATGAMRPQTGGSGHPPTRPPLTKQTTTTYKHASLRSVHARLETLARFPTYNIFPETQKAHTDRGNIKTTSHPVLAACCPKFSRWLARQGGRHVRLFGECNDVADGVQRLYAVQPQLYSAGRLGHHRSLHAKRSRAANSWHAAIPTRRRCLESFHTNRGVPHVPRVRMLLFVARWSHVPEFLAKPWHCLFVYLGRHIQLPGSINVRTADPCGRGAAACDLRRVCLARSGRGLTYR